MKLFSFIKRLWCKHRNQKFWRNIYGDEINRLNCRSIWECRDCEKIIRSNSLFYPINEITK